ncbi:MAG: hypothetical protein K8Q88_04290 [Nitrosarchaeum sp.]|nr:hypothetical protein [Nitrosarchaeum sp.]
MNRLVIILILGIFTIGILTVSLISDNFVDANSTKKINFTKTIISSQDPGQGYENHQLALILSPNEGTLYDGSMTFTSSEPVEIVVLHEINSNDAKGQPTWTIDGNTIYAISIIDLKTKSGSFEFTGAALALHSLNSKEFTSTVSVDGWIRGQPTEIITQKIKVQKESSLLLSRTNVAATIPMHEGLYNGNSIFYIITDSSQQEYAEMITKKQGWKVETAPPIEKIPEDTLQKIFVFKNGVNGDGIYGHQKEIFSSTPSQELEYSALNSVIEVIWKKGQNAKILESSEEIINAEEDGRIEFNKTGIVINAPQIIWPDGQMLVRDDKEITDDLTFGGGQITEINKDEMTVTFVAHREWGPDGKTIYYIVTDATPSGPAEMMGVPFSPRSENLITNSSAVDLFQFQNGIKGSGSLGFQPGIATVTPGSENYSPMWRIYIIEWNDPENAKILETISDINSFKADDLISVSLARPMNNHHIVNSPLIDPFQ